MVRSHRDEGRQRLKCAFTTESLSNVGGTLAALDDEGSGSWVVKDPDRGW